MIDAALLWNKDGTIPSEWRADVNDVIEEQFGDDNEDEVDEEEKEKVSVHFQLVCWNVSGCYQREWVFLPNILKEKKNP